LFEETFGPGTGYAAAGIELVTVGLDAVAHRPRPARASANERRRATSRPTSRQVWFDGWHETSILDGATLEAGDAVDGPAIVAWGATSVVVAPGRSVTLDPEGMLHLSLAPEHG